MQKIAFFVVLLMVSFSSYAQPNLSKIELQLEIAPSQISQRCHTMENFEIRLQNDPAYRKSHEEYIRDFVKPNIDNSKSIACTGANTINVPVAFHFDNSFSCADATCMLTEIDDAITTLNNDFADNTGSPNAANCSAAYSDISTGTCITFYLAAPPACSGLDVTCEGAITIGEFQGGYNGGANGAGACWDDYLNIFVQSAQSNNLGVSDQIPGYLNAAGPGEGVSLGAPYFGGVGGACAPFDTNNRFGLGKTLAHEIGHYLGLPHIWGDVNGGGCGGDDGFADTPNQSTSYFGCPGGCIASGCNGNQQTANIMNYTDDACMDLFTEDQAAEMNFYANQFFGALSIPAASPTEIYTCTGNTCNVVCPTKVQTVYSDTEELCAALGTYTLPTDFSSVTLDNSSSATFTWSTGNYISSGGTAITGTTYTLSNPPTCAPVTETLYLNVGCTDNSIQEINAGTIVLTVYPDPTQFVVADLVTFTDGACDAPTWAATAGCAPYVTVTQNGGPTFPVASGASGTVDYDVTLTYPAECCSVPASDIILTGTIGTTTLNAGNASQTCVSGTNPAVWQIPFTIPTAQNATTINPTGLGSITEVCIDITLNNTDAVNLTLGSPDCGAYEWESIWLGLAFTNGTNTGPMTVCFTPSAANGEFDGTFDGDDGTSGSFGTCDVNANQWILYIGDYNCYIGGGATGGSINSATISFNDGTQAGATGLCEFTATANYNCAGCTDCNNTTCITTQICNDADPCTENDIETILTTGGICIPCAGTPVAACTLQDVPNACDDNDTCTINDVVIIDACTGAVCVPCAGTFDQASCCGDVNLDINFDNNPSQTSWDITDASGNVVASGGTYGSQAGGSNLNLSPAACLPDGCYDLNFYDSANDGMCPRRTTTVLTGINIATLGLGGVFNGAPRITAATCGDYTLTDANGVGLASGGGRFGTSETNNFCLVNGVAQFNYQSGNVHAKQSTSNDSESSMWLMPTLTSDKLMVYTSLDNAVQAQINVVDTNGRIMQQHSQDSNSSGEMQLKVSDLPTGIYFVQVVADGTVLVEKFVKK